MTTTTINRPQLCNVSNDRPIPICDLAAQVRDLGGNRLVRIAGGLHYVEGPQVRPLHRAADLFAWLDKYAEVKWLGGKVTKDEFFCGLTQSLPDFAWATPYPHFPPLPGVLYLGGAPP